MNLGELRTAAYDWLLMSSTENLASPTELNRYLNQAQRRLHRRVVMEQLNFFSATTDLSEAADTATIDLPTTLYEIQFIERIAGTNASEERPIPMRRIGKSNDSFYENRVNLRYGGLSGSSNRLPLTYAVEGKARIRLMPTPKNAQTNSIRLYYTFKAADMTADTHVPFQETAGTGGSGTDDLSEFHEIIWMMAAMLVASKEEDSPRYGLLRAELDTLLEELDQYVSSVDNSPRWVQAALEDDDMFDGY